MLLIEYIVKYFTSLKCLSTLFTRENSMNADGTWPHAFINAYWKDRMTSFWQRMQRHVHENRDWAQNTWWMPVDANVNRVNWDNCHIQNWDYQWFLDPTRRAPQWQDLTHAYRQWWMYTSLPSDSDLKYYLAWLEYEDGECDRKQRQLQRWIDDWNNLSQRSKMGFFDPVLPTAHVHAAKLQVGCASMARNPYVIANTIATAKIPWPWHSRQQEQHGQGHVPRVWASVPMADQWPIMRVLRDEKRWCMAHGIPAPSLGPSSVGVPDTDENWFTYSNFDTWWHHLTDHQRLLLWEQRGGSSTWQPPKDFEGEWTGWN